MDDSPELTVAMRYACRRAKRTGGRVALLYVMDPPEPQQWGAVSDLMREEARHQAEELTARYADQVLTMTGQRAIVHIREGQRRDQLLALLGEDPSISVLVLASGTGAAGPGPLVSALAGRYIGQVKVALTIIPGGLSEQQVDAIS